MQLNPMQILRRLRDGSALGRRIHASLREPYYTAMMRIHPSGVEVELPGRCRVRVHPKLLGIRPDTYEPDFSALLDRLARPGMIVLDIGAHVGLHTLRLARRAGSAGRIVAVEPSPANAALLKTHLAWNGFANVEVVEAAVGQRPGEIEFACLSDALDPGSFANSLAYDIGGSRVKVRVTTIDDLCRDLVPDLIKIDIEGAEMQAIIGGRQTLLRHHPLLLVAIHPEAMASLGATPAQLIDALAALGYRGRHLDGRPLSGPVGFEELVFEKVSR